jgi:cytosine/adenosine deaminase-related metal-dependent hydrolase
LPHLQHLHRLGPFRHGVRSPPARGARHRYRRRVVLLDAAHHGRGLRDRPTPGIALHPAELLWLATGASARALGLETTIGRIAPGFEADLTILDLASTPAIAQAHARAEDIWQALFHTIMMGDDRAIAATYVAGRRIDA